VSKPRDIRQTVRLPASPDELFESYLDPARHAAITGQPVQIAPEPGGEFRTFDGVISRRIVAVVPKRLIVQTWRASHWKKDDSEGWDKYYWTPWRKYLGQG